MCMNCVIMGYTLFGILKYHSEMDLVLGIFQIWDSLIHFLLFTCSHMVNTSSVGIGKVQFFDVIKLLLLTSCVLAILIHAPKH